MTARETLIVSACVRARKLGTAPTHAMIDELAVREWGGMVADYYRGLSDQGVTLLVNDATTRFRREQL